MVLVKRLLQRSEGAVTCKPFHCGDGGTVGLAGEHQAAAHRPAIDIYRASAAHAMGATDMGAGQMQMVANEIDQQQPRLDLAFVGAAVDGDAHRDAVLA